MDSTGGFSDKPTEDVLFHSMNSIPIPESPKQPFSLQSSNYSKFRPSSTPKFHSSKHPIFPNSMSGNLHIPSTPHMCRPKRQQAHNPISTALATPQQYQTQSPPTSTSSQLRSASLLFTLSELSAATHGFKSLRLGSDSAAVWKCILRGAPAVVSSQPLPRRQFRADFLADLCRVRHNRIARLLGACVDGPHAYLVHEFAPGANLAHCLRGSRAVGYSAIWKWTHRVRVGLDVAKALEYLHHDIPTRGYVHKHVKPSCIIVSEPEYRAKLARYGSHALEWEPPEPEERTAAMRRSGSRKISGTQGYMAAEYLKEGRVTAKMDVYAFGVVLLELVTGEMAVRYEHEGREEYRKIALVDEVMGRELGGEELRMWVDGRMMDSYPLNCVERVVGIARACVDPTPEKRPNMRWVAAKISAVLRASERWAEEMRVDERVSVSLACR
ncbi:hypothetical protein ACLOJK_020497 [Asimina triloba]